MIDGNSFEFYILAMADHLIHEKGFTAVEVVDLLSDMMKDHDEMLKDDFYVGAFGKPSMAKELRYELRNRHGLYINCDHDVLSFDTKNDKTPHVDGGSIDDGLLSFMRDEEWHNMSAESRRQLVEKWRKQKEENNGKVENA